MPRLFVVSCSAIAAGALAATSATGASTPAPPPSRTLTLTARPTGGGFIDNPPRRPSLGDSFYESGTLLDARRHRVGRYQINGQLVGGTVKQGTEQVATTAFLAGGQIAIVGGHATTSRYTLPVVGGTGVFTGTTGTFSVQPGSQGTETVTLVLRSAQ